MDIGEDRAEASRGKPHVDATGAHDQRMGQDTRLAGWPGRAGAQCAGEIAPRPHAVVGDELRFVELDVADPRPLPERAPSDPSPWNKSAEPAAPSAALPLARSIVRPGRPVRGRKNTVSASLPTNQPVVAFSIMTWGDEPNTIIFDGS